MTVPFGNKNGARGSDIRWQKRAEELGFQTELGMWFYLKVFEHWSDSAIADMFGLYCRDTVSKRRRKWKDLPNVKSGGRNSTKHMRKQRQIAINHPDFRQYYRINTR